MSMKRQLKKVLPDPVVRALRKIVPEPQADPFAPFKQSSKAAAAARDRFSLIEWPSEAKPRAIYALTPTATLRNIGDHAQVVAIERWLMRHYPGHPIVELDKGMVLSCIDVLKARVTPKDLIFLHSGGNLGDRGRWSEAARRTMVSAFPDNRIVSLPQTIFFSDTPLGRHERDISSTIYGRHRRLTVIGRDEVSGELAAQLFPHAQIATVPDFVLSLKAEDFGLQTNVVPTNRIMACLRQDNESVIAETTRHALARSLGEATLFDTTLDRDIGPMDRAQVLRETLNLFLQHKAVVTDRFHGLIFSVICRKPTVLLRTIDHKLTSAVAWFKDIPNVQFCDSVADVGPQLQRVLSTPVEQYPDFNGLYFDRLPALIAEIP
jgi:pyruvyl transferase EpsI